MLLLTNLNVFLKLFQAGLADRNVCLVENDAPVLQYRNAFLANNVGTVHPNEILGGQYGFQFFQRAEAEDGLGLVLAMDFDIIVITLYIVYMFKFHTNDAVSGFEINVSRLGFRSLKRQTLEGFVGRCQEGRVGIGGEQKVQCIQPETIEGLALVR